MAPALPAAAASIDLAVTMPSDYPGAAPLLATCLNVDTKLNRSQIAQLNAQIKLHLEDDEFAGEGHSKLALIDCVSLSKLAFSATDFAGGGFGMPLNSRTHVVFIGSLWYLLSVVC